MRPSTRSLKRDRFPRQFENPRLHFVLPPIRRWGEARNASCHEAPQRSYFSGAPRHNGNRCRLKIDRFWSNNLCLSIKANSDIPCYRCGGLFDLRLGRGRTLNRNQLTRGRGVRSEGYQRHGCGGALKPRACRTFSFDFRFDFAAAISIFEMRAPRRATSTPR